MIFKPIFVLTVALFLVSISSVYAETSLYDILDHEVGYDIENGKILAMNLDTDVTSLTIEIVSFDDGFIELGIPRGLLDATFDGEDDVFFVFIDGTESDYLEIDLDDSNRTLIIPFFVDDQEIEILGTSVLSNDPITVEIPSWVKNNAGWWSKGVLDDTDFIAGIKYLINKDVIIISPTEPVESIGSKIPSWVKNNAGWWSKGVLDDTDFIAGIKYLIQQGIISV